MSTTEIMDTSLRVKRRHKVRSEALKREIVAACAVPGASVSVVARQYDVNANLVFTWRKLYGAAPEMVAPQLVPVVVTPDQPHGYRVRVGNNIKSVALRVVLDALERR